MFPFCEIGYFRFVQLETFNSNVNLEVDSCNPKWIASIVILVIIANNNNYYYFKNAVDITYTIITTPKVQA